MATAARLVPGFSFAATVAIMSAAVALAVGGLLPAQSVLLAWLVLGLVVGYVFYCIKGDLLTAVLLWFITLIAFHEEFWRKPLPVFFTLTVPRVGIVVLVALAIGMLAVGRFRIRHAWPASVFILATAVYFSLSALVSGFETSSVVSVHYRLIGGYLFPFTVFALVLHAFNTERDFKRLVAFFAILSVYLTATGWFEQFKVAPLIFPRFINDPTVGIHWGRVRGPFVMSAAMGLALIYCFFNNLVLARNVLRGRWLLYTINLAMIPVIFWTKASPRPKTSRAMSTSWSA